MATQRQVALPGTYGTQTTNSKVPMFLQKLYKIVDDPSTNDVICWADSGDSFFVLDHERLAKEHLGKWFKHNKFPSFVRQLNMYGFHKIPHLQQGVLKSDSTTEHWQFVHEHFRRGEEDRLMFIERKKQQTQPKQASTSTEQQHNLMLLPPPESSQPNQASALDMNSIVNGIAAIRRHQTTISSELSDLKQSNEALWRESMEARNRHTQQQDTVNRIIRFLAGIFGQQGSTSTHTDSDSGPTNPGAVVPRTRLMIEDRERNKDPNTRVRMVEVEDEDAKSVGGESSTPHLQTNQTSAASTPDPFPLSPQNSFADSPQSTTTQQHNPNGIISTQAHYPEANTSTNAQSRDLISPSRSPNQSAQIQSALSQLSAFDLQQLFASLGGNMPTLDPHSADTGGLLTPHAGQPRPEFDFGPLSPTLHSIGEPPPNAPSQFMTNEDGLISFDDPPYKLDKQWQATEDIDKDVTSLNTGINSLMETLGLSPEYLVDNNIDPSLQSTPQQDDQMFSTFLNTFPPGEDELPQQTTSGFVSADSPVTAAPTPESAADASKRKKRKSDVALSEPTTNSVPDSMTSMFDAGTGETATPTRSKRRKG